MVDLRNLRPLLERLPLTSPTRRCVAALAWEHLERQAISTPRQFYLPPHIRNTAPEVPDGTDLAIWRWEEYGKYFATAFQASANKPLIHAVYNRQDSRDRAVEALIHSRRGQLQRKQEVQQQRRLWKHPVKVGEIYYTSWGYDQTQHDFYEVTQVAGAAVILREVAKKEVGTEGPYSLVAPIPHRFVGDPIRKVPQMGGGGFPILKVEDHYAHLWQPGKRLMDTSGYAGH